ncbi:MAG: hypothetical protein AAGE96_21265 [Cyanobacteria bacterium P01_G01_bin.19]
MSTNGCRLRDRLDKLSVLESASLAQLKEPGLSYLYLWGDVRFKTASLH